MISSWISSFRATQRCGCLDPVGSDDLAYCRTSMQRRSTAESNSVGRQRPASWRTAIVRGTLWLVAFATVAAWESQIAALLGAEPPKVVLIAGRPSHPPRMHEFNAGVQLLAKCLRGHPGLRVEFVLNGWPADEKVFDDAAAVVFYMDGGGNHEVVKENGRRKPIVDGWAKKGIGLGFMHYGVEIVADQAGAEFKRWIGGHYEHMFSCNPIGSRTSRRCRITRSLAV